MFRKQGLSWGQELVISSATVARQDALVLKMIRFLLVSEVPNQMVVLKNYQESKERLPLVGSCALKNRSVWKELKWYLRALCTQIQQELESHIQSKALWIMAA